MSMYTQTQMEQFLQDLFGPDLLLPEQFYAPQPGAQMLSGTRGLMWAVLIDGVERFRHTARSHSAQDVEEYLETEQWLKAVDTDSVFSFVNLCELFGLHAEPLRKALLEWRDRSHGAARRQRFRPAVLRAA
jgi:hypothetical protein